jgi:nicotinamidase-related amidase
MPEEAGWRKALESWPKFAPRFVLDAERTALVLVDMQKGYLLPEGGLGEYLHKNYPEAADYYLSRVADMVVPNHQRMLSFFREHSLPVIYITFASHLPDASDWLPLRRQRDEEIEAEHGRKTAILHQGLDEARVLDALAPREGELVVNKVSRGAFNSTGIEALLRNMGITGLVMAGVVTNVCVETTARDAADRGFQVVLVDDACASYNQAAHDACMQIFAGIFGRVLTTEEVMSELTGQLADHSV